MNTDHFFLRAPSDLAERFYNGFERRHTASHRSNRAGDFYLFPLDGFLATFSDVFLLMRR